MRDIDIRKLLVQKLRAKSLRKAGVVLQEVPVSDGKARADLVNVSEKLECFEIKSEFDSLKRLVTQGWHYGRAFNNVTLVAAVRHIETAEHLIPLWWGIIKVTESGKLLQHRKPLNNPSITTHGLSELLDRQEAIDLLSLKGFTKGTGKMSKKSIYESLSTQFDIEELNRHVLFKLKSREHARFLESKHVIYGDFEPQLYAQ